MRGHPLQTAVYGQRNGRTGCQLAGSAGIDRPVVMMCGAISQINFRDIRPFGFTSESGRREGNKGDKR
jgi:hypothetical protein